VDTFAAFRGFAAEVGSAPAADPSRASHRRDL